MSVTEDVGPPAYPGPAKSLADQILEANDVETKLYNVPEWGVKLELRSPTGEERGALVSSFLDLEQSAATGSPQMRDLKTMYPSLVIACAYDPETGERVFEHTPGTIAALNGKNGAVLERVAMACMPLAGLSADEVEEGKDDSSTSPMNGSTSR